jgi:hypothetical protein
MGNGWVTTAQANDTGWLATELVRLGLTTADEIEQRATVALTGYVGGQAMLRLNLRAALALARQVEAERGAVGYEDIMFCMAHGAWRMAHGAWRLVCGSAWRFW